ncbi:MAG: hypothetical protein COB36_10345 [Alphaproteobacteria bacterium]|nr:MAG: hypothetical protein COB36_10345 [Alphaproteobacteria bacterium]
MIRKILFLPFFLLIFSVPVYANQTDWTEKKLGRVILKADKASRQKKWGRAIKYGEQILKGAEALDQHNDARYINMLKNLNRYYDKAKRLSDVPIRVKEAYILSKNHLGLSHKTTNMSRHLYYKLVISDKNYAQATLLVLESISLLKDDKEDDYRLLHYLKQLYSLYGLTAQLKEEERTLLRYLVKSQQLLGEDDEDAGKVIWILAQNYCLQKKTPEFKKLKKNYKLGYVC